MMSNYVITVYVSSDPGTYMVRESRLEGGE
jgi:hypothetical protein